MGSDNNLMTKILYLLVITCLTIVARCQTNIYNWIIKTSVSGTVNDIEYSPDQKYIAMAKSSQLVLYDGVTAYSKYSISYGTIFAFSSFSFSQDSSIFAVGFSAGDGSLQVKVFTVQTGEELLTIESPSKENAVLTVNSVCFTADNTRLIYSTSLGDIFSYRFSDKSTKSIKFGDIPAASLACSPIRSLQFTAGGSNTQGKQSKLKIYNIDPITNEIAQLKDFTLTDPDETVNGLTYSASGAYLYRCGSVKAYKCNMNTYTEEALPIRAGLKDFVKIRVSKDEKVIAVSTKDKSLYMLKFIPDANAQMEQVESIGITGFGLSPNSLNTMFMMSSNTMAQVSSQCKINQILNPVDGTCLSCNSNCRMCFEQVTTCKLCYEAFYLEQTTSKCSSCMSRCKDCPNGLTCSVCYSPFILLNGNKQCGCVQGQYVNQNTCSPCFENCLDCTSATTCSSCATGYFAQDNLCKTCAEGCLKCNDLKTCVSCAEDYELENGICEVSRFPVWAIVMLVILGLCLVAIIAGVVFIKMRKQKRSPLLTDSDEGALTND